jgi:hypothetical protein
VCFPTILLILSEKEIASTTLKWKIRAGEPFLAEVEIAGVSAENT